MPIDFTGTPAGSAFISDYAGGSKTATLTDTLNGSTGVSTNYQTPANVLYAPASVSISSLTIYLYLDGLLYKLVGCRGSFNLTLTSGGVGRLSFTFQGLYLSKADTAVPAATYDATRPAPFKNGTMLVNRLAAALESLSIDLGNEQSFPDNPNALEGFDSSIIVRRNLTGSMNPLETLIATPIRPFRLLGRGADGPGDGRGQTARQEARETALRGYSTLRESAHLPDCHGDHP